MACSDTRESYGMSRKSSTTRNSSGLPRGNDSYSLRRSFLTMPMVLMPISRAPLNIWREEWEQIVAILNFL